MINITIWFSATTNGERVEAVLKFVRPIGFTAMYYTYNSMNSVKTERSVDGCHTVTTYYNYNQEGLVDSVWHRFDNNGLLINNGVPATCGNLYYQALPTIPGYPDIALLPQSVRPGNENELSHEWLESEIYGGL